LMLKPINNFYSKANFYPTTKAMVKRTMFVPNKQQIRKKKKNLKMIMVTPCIANEGNDL